MTDENEEMVNAIVEINGGEYGMEQTPVGWLIIDDGDYVRNADGRISEFPELELPLNWFTRTKLH